jgi:CspA family cold shock protein
MRQREFVPKKAVLSVRHSGRVKWFDENRGYGIIRGSEGGEFPVRYADIEEEGYKSLAEGERVEFEIIDDNGGMRAIRVNRLPAGDG